jgi:D-alanyl-lipoteichoic acid acyltransferase DltB (MBOAT superfamily)
MSLISIQFLLFVLFGMLCYYLAPDRHKWKFLLIFSVSYYLIICNKYILYMLVTVLTTYFGTRKIEQIYGQMHCTIKENKGIWEREQRVAYKKGMENRARRTMILVLLLNLGILGVVKYAGFVTDIFVGLCNAFGMQLESPEFHFLLPLGISFYTFQSMGYVIDVYQEKIPAERNLGKVALFVSFFPQIIQGPIAMYDDLARQLYEPHSFDWERTKKAGLLILWGLFKKLVIADRAVLFINYITADSSQFRGTFILIAVLLYALQLYADFSGGIDVVRGIGELFGITMAENFRRPYFSLSLTEYWHRWHITLGNWVRNYVFYPLSISKGFINMGKWMSKHWNRHFGKVVPTSLASVITFLIIGIWHGANGKYVAFGLWNGLVIMVIELLQPVTDKVKKCLHVKEESKFFHLVCMVWTFLLVLVGYYFDVANNFKDAMQMMYRSVTDVHLADLSHFSDVLLKCGLDFADFRLLLFSAGVLFVVSCVQEKKNLEIREWILSRKTFFRWGIVYVCMFFVLVFGFYGFGINPADFIYTQF